MYFYQGNVALYLYIANVFKYLFLSIENRGSYSYYYYIKVIRFSLYPLPRSSSLPICCWKTIVLNNVVTNCLNLRKKS